jgi:single-stranded DNA-binding protein
MAPVYAWRNLSKFAKTLQNGQLVILEGILRYREVEDEVKGTTFKRRIAEIHAISIKRLSKVEAADDPDGIASMPGGISQSSPRLSRRCNSSPLKALCGIARSRTRLRHDVQAPHR